MAATCTAPDGDGDGAVRLDDLPLTSNARAMYGKRDGVRATVFRGGHKAN